MTGGRKNKNNECFMDRVFVWEYENIWKWTVVMVAQKPVYLMPTD